VQATKQQQIVVYFIEEAREHLDTIEQGLLDLQATMEDTERLNELFRAAHSVKGGAAMLGFNAIQKVGHHLEDCFKLLKENAVRVDQQLENLFLQGFDVLKYLVTELQSPYGLQEPEVEKALKSAEPMFEELERYLNQLIQGEVTSAAKPPTVAANLPAVMNGALKKMLELFKQGDTPIGRQQLVGLCTKMTQLHSGLEWQQLMQLAGQAIANSKVSYKVLAPLLIKELKQAGELLVTGRCSELTPSQALLQLASGTASGAGVAKGGVPATAPKSAPAVVAPAAGIKPGVTRSAGTPSTVSKSAAPPLADAQPTAPQAAAAPAYPSQAVAPVTKNSKAQHITVPMEPRAAARALLEAFNKNQLIELAEYLMKAIQ
jgi:chemotaxis protein histidine kinase CheA